MLSRVVFVACVAFAVAAEWKVAQKNIATIVTGITDTENSKEAYIAGDQNGSGDFIAFTNDSAATFTMCDLESQELLLMDLSVRSKQGLTGGANFLVTKPLAFTKDGYKWDAAPDPDILLVTQSVQNIKGVAGGFAAVGQATATVGVTATLDDSLTFKHFPITILDNVTMPRYGAFPSKDVWYVTAGSWPGEDDNDDGTSDDDDDFPPQTACTSQWFSFNHRFEVDHGCKRFKSKNVTYLQNHNLGNITQFHAEIVKSTDGGATWTSVYKKNATDQFYFNAISCVSVDECWAVAEGLEVVILHTSNGGSTWERQMTDTTPESGMMAIDMFSATEGWALGYTRNSGNFYYTSDGKTWTLKQTIFGVLPNNIKGPFASAFNILDQSDVLALV